MSLLCLEASHLLDLDGCFILCHITRLGRATAFQLQYNKKEQDVSVLLANASGQVGKHCLDERGRESARACAA